MDLAPTAGTDKERELTQRDRSIPERDDVGVPKLQRDPRVHHRRHPVRDAWVSVIPSWWSRWMNRNPHERTDPKHQEFDTLVVERATAEKVTECPVKTRFQTLHEVKVKRKNKDCVKL